MKDGRHIIWSNDIDYDDWREDLEEQYPDLTEAERMERMYELNGDYLDDERSNLDIQLSRPILVVGDLGLWHGRRMGYKEIPSGNIRDCLYSERDIDYSTWYVDKNGDFRCDAIHHDGTNHYLYRAYKDGVSDTQIENREHKIIRFDTLSGFGEYEIVAVFKTVTYSEQGFKYYHFTRAESAEDFDDYIAQCKALSLYDTGVTAEYGDRLITLSTCEYSRKNGRMVVVAKRIAAPSAEVGSHA